MKFGLLTDYFDGVAAKYLTETEVNPQISHQHEFQGVGDFRRLLGEPADKRTFEATYLWFDGEEPEKSLNLKSTCTWSDVRRGSPDRAAEYHLYYSAESRLVVHKARAGDLLVIVMKKDGSLLIIICSAGTTISQQLLWLFGLDLSTQRVEAKTLDEDGRAPLGFAARAVINELGVEIDEPEPDALGMLVETFGVEGFPSTRAFSEFARETCVEVDPIDAPDEALLAWMDHEEALFYHFERYIIERDIKAGFVVDGRVDVDRFLSFSLSVQNRRKSRAGWAFGHHIEAILQHHDLRYKREARTEKPNGPDFLFPGEDEYHDSNFNADLLLMLGIKTSCKERWRQVLAEANRIKEKHLLTLEAGISEFQTSEMQTEKLQLVVPGPIFSSYTPTQQAWLMDVGSFIHLAKEKQT